MSFPGLSGLACHAASDGLIWPRVGCASIATRNGGLQLLSPAATRHSLRDKQVAARRPPLRFGPRGCGAIAPGLLIAIEAAMVAARATDKEN